MSRLIKKEGRYFKECNVVMLSTEFNKESLIDLYIDGTLRLSNKTLGEKWQEEKGSWQPQHLNITSNDKIKEGDWCIIWTLANTYFLVQYQNNKYYHRFQNNGKGYNTEKEVEGRVSKIIATTNKSLKIPCYDCRETIGWCTCDTKSLPQPSHKFIKAYCEQGGIDKVLVEYEKVNISACTCDSLNCPNSFYNGDDYSCSKRFENGEFWKTTYKLKTDSHNTITIKSVSNHTKEIKNLMWLTWRASNVIFEDEVALKEEFEHWYNNKGQYL